MQALRTVDPGGRCQHETVRRRLGYVVVNAACAAALPRRRNAAPRTKHATSLLDEIQATVEESASEVVPFNRMVALLTGGTQEATLL